jgi:carbonic anhydrase
MANYEDNGEGAADGILPAGEDSGARAGTRHGAPDAPRQHELHHPLHAGPLHHLFENNGAWVDEMLVADPEYFSHLAEQQTPEYLWIGCSDSRVPANQIIGLPPGEVFVHRNIANVVVHSDLNCLSVIQFAVDQLKIKHIMVVGHYGCSGVGAALFGRRIGLADNWLRHIRDVYDKHAALLADWPMGEARHRRLVELNAIEQVVHVCRTTIVQDAWSRGQELTVHGWAYGVHDGKLRNLGMTIDEPGALDATYAFCVAAVGHGGAQAPIEHVPQAPDARI